MEGITFPELLECTLNLLDTTLDGGLVDLRLGGGGTSGSGPYPGRSTYGGDYQPGAFGSGGVSGQWTQGGGVESGTIGAVGS